MEGENSVQVKLNNEIKNENYTNNNSYRGRGGRGSYNKNVSYKLK